MTISRANQKLISMFVLAFLCLNAVGFLCLAYCGGVVKAQAEHCPLKKTAPHCPHSQTPVKPSDDASISSFSIKCCMLPIGIVGTPTEVKANVDVAPATVVTVNPPQVQWTPASVSRDIPDLFYRPPPNDRRTDRIRNRVFRI